MNAPSELKLDEMLQIRLAVMQREHRDLDEAIRALEAASSPMGFNIGMNQGAVAGAGVAAHLHQHIVPRWGGDMNFLPIIGQTKALPILLEDSRARIVEHWADPPAEGST